MLSFVKIESSHMCGFQSLPYKKTQKSKIKFVPFNTLRQQPQKRAFVFLIVFWLVPLFARSYFARPAPTSVFVFLQHNMRISLFNCPLVGSYLARPAPARARSKNLKTAVAIPLLSRQLLPIFPLKALSVSSLFSLDQSDRRGITWN